MTKNYYIHGNTVRELEAPVRQNRQTREEIEQAKRRKNRRNAEQRWPDCRFGGTIGEIEKGGSYP